jgi:YHS domain-containing protein
VALNAFLVAAALLAPVAAETGKSPVSGKEFEVTEKTPRLQVQGRPVFFATAEELKAFLKAPERYVRTVGACPVLGGDVTPSLETRVVINNSLWYVCCPVCPEKILVEEKVLKELVDPVSGKKFKATVESPRADFEQQVYYFETAANKAVFEKEPAKFAVLFAR